MLRATEALYFWAVRPSVRAFVQAGRVILRPANTFRLHKQRSVRKGKYRYHTSLFLAELGTLYSRREHSTQRFYKRNTDCSPSCLNYLLLEQRDFVTKLRRAQTNTNLIELELNDSETPVFRTVYPISIASSYSFTIFLCFMSNLYLYFYCNCVNPACIAATLNKRFRFWFWYRNWRVAF